MRKRNNARLKALIAVALTILVLVPTVGFVWFGWWDIAQNRKVLNSLPLPPEAKRTEISSSGVARKDHFLAPPKNWSTRATFEIPGYSREYLADFYISRLWSEWEYCMRIHTPGVRFVRDDHTLLLSTEGASSPTGGGLFTIHISPYEGWNPCN